MSFLGSPNNPGSTGVASIFGRVGAVIAQAGDYTAAQITNAADKAAAGSQQFAGLIGGLAGMFVSAGQSYFLDAGGTVGFSEPSANLAALTGADLTIATLGRGLRIKEGANGRMGTATLVGGTVTVANTSVTATTRIFITDQTAGGTLGTLSVSARTTGTSFTVTSSNALDTSTFCYLLIEPG